MDHTAVAGETRRVSFPIVWLALAWLGASVLSAPTGPPPAGYDSTAAAPESPSGPAYPKDPLGLWSEADPSAYPSGAKAWIRPERLRACHLDRARLQPLLAHAPPEQAQALTHSTSWLSLPLPQGGFAHFRFVTVAVMAPELAAKFPEIQTFLGQGIEDPTATVRFDLTPAGFHAQILRRDGAVQIDPLFQGHSEWHAVYFRKDHRRFAGDFRCLTPASTAESSPSARDSISLPAPLPPPPPFGTSLRVYRLACAAMGEYTQFHGGSVANGLAAIVTAIHRVNGVYETDLAIRLQLVANNDRLVYTNAATDPYTGSDPNVLLNQNQANLDTVIGNANYDVGHLFGTRADGRAYLGVVCAAGLKAGGYTGSAAPVGDPFFIDYVAHELGHQFGANHTFNGTNNACGGWPPNRNAATAYEPGSGSTVMSYAGICGLDDLQAHSDAYFHSASLEEILSFVTSGPGSACPLLLPTSNSLPVLTAPASFVIPQGTPFRLTAAAADPDGDSVTYCWEQRDLGPAQSLGAPDNGMSPLFRSFPPAPGPTRAFPQLTGLLAGIASRAECLPVTNRTMHFRVTVRDHCPAGGGMATADTEIQVASNAGPFVVTSPNAPVTWSNLHTVTWEVAGTTNPPVSAAAVNILLSTNGGLTFPIVLAAQTPNDGAETVQFPMLNTAAARIQVEAANHIFFDISDTDFSLLSFVPAPRIELDTITLLRENCTAPNQALDPGESVIMNLLLRNVGTAPTTNLVVTLLATNGVLLPGAPQRFGVLPPDGQAVARPFAFVVGAPCGSNLVAVLELRDGAAFLETVEGVLPVGTNTYATFAFANPASISIPDHAPADPYPSTLTVSNLPGRVAKVTVTLTDFSHPYPDDVDVLLVGPQGQHAMLLSDAGGDLIVKGLNLTFDDDAPSPPPDNLLLSTGTWQPSNFDYTPDDFAPPAPAGPHGYTLGVFNGTDPNGTWSLFIQDDEQQLSGGLAAGWSLTITTVAPLCCDGPVAADLQLVPSALSNQVNLGSEITLRLWLTNAGPAEAYAVAITNRLPPGLAFVSAATTHGTWDYHEGHVVFALGDLASGAACELTLNAVVQNPGALWNVAQVAASTTDPLPANNAAVTVLVANTPPAIASLPDLETLEDTPIQVALSLSDAETPPESLSVSGFAADTNLVPETHFIFKGAGPNRMLTLWPATNQFGSTVVTLEVSDGLASNSVSFNLTVLPVNDPPTLAPIPDQLVIEGRTLIWTNLAFDPDAPPNTLRFSLATNAPPAMQLDPVNGWLTWTPDEPDSPSTNTVTVVVTDDGEPPLSDSQSFLLTVLPRLVFKSVTSSNRTLSLRWRTIPGRSYRLQYLDTLAASNWTDLSPDLTAEGGELEATDPVHPQTQRFYRVQLLP